jgi:large subunit ribosomal protein L27
MAHKKGQGSVKNGRDSKPKRRGVKIYGGQAVKQSGIIVVQCGTKYAPGRFVRRASNDFLYATTAGKVYFDQGGKRVNVLPDDAASALV